MAIEAQLYPSNQFYGSKNLMVCLNSQAYGHKHNLQQPEQQQCLQHLHHARQMNQTTSLVDPTFSCFSNSNAQNNAFNKYNHNAQPLASYPQHLATELDEQRDIDHYIRSQNEKLRVLLQEQRKQHMAELLKKMELNALHLLKQKDEEIVQASNKTMELKEFLRRLEVEKESWRKVAEEKEAVILYLHNNLEQMKERAVHGMTSEDAESCCDDNMRITAAMGEGTGEKRVWHSSGVGEVEQIRKKTMDCKCCNSQKSCFMFLPCRHLCSCKTCEPFLQVCPVCSMPKKSSIETLIT
ncbi:hypothetical protein PHAVU_009G119200 [Phaseolus vulgaris]|uniref:RING-type domain-containing protein n=1 Tax=Phaseolus vulgaris TaxID=3885 RepID=V7AXK1_PHAVU|nr:hypothetical protein PHAVU_009G119200g [Phaseolus vulgaris]ESW09338.1 hypothetical protein PHAVU_009G119200g [Phaseolus vulgaris]